MSDPTRDWKKTRTKVSVQIPTPNGKEIAETIEVEVDAYRNPANGEFYFDGEALDKLDDVKARHMGLLLPEEIRELREQLGVTQKRIAELLQIGEKSYSRWETGRERPSRSINILLAALADGRIDVAYLESQMTPDFNWRRQVERSVKPENRVVPFGFRKPLLRIVETDYEAVAA